MFNKRQAKISVSYDNIKNCLIKTNLKKSQTRHIKILTFNDLILNSKMVPSMIDLSKSSS